MLLNLTFNFILTLFIFWIFRNNKTSYILGYSILVFITAFIYFIYIGFEFVALVFIITYIGGIAVMFLFLILVLDVNVENVKPKRALFSSIYPILFIISAIVFSVKILSAVYNPFIFNNLEFSEFIINNIFEALETLINFPDISKIFYDNENLLHKSTSFMEFLSLSFNSCGITLALTHEYMWSDLFRILEHEKFALFFTESVANNCFDFIINSHIINFSDITALGFFVFCYYGALLIFVALYLLIALIVSIFIGSGIFQLEKY